MPKQKIRVHLLIEMMGGLITDTFIYADDNLAMAKSDYLDRIIDEVSQSLDMDELILKRHPEFVMDYYGTIDREDDIYLFENHSVMTKED